MEIKDILGFGAAGVKLIEQLSIMGGYIFKPRLTIANAKATSKAIKLLKEENENISSIEINDGKILVKVENDESLSLDIANIVSQEVKKQENINSVVLKTIDILKSSFAQDININLEKAWTLNFIENCKFVSDEEMQNTWARILADECTGKAKYSIKTLQILKLMSKNDAELFIKVASCAFNFGDLYVIVNFDDSRSIYGTNTIELLALNDLGLIHESYKYLNIEKLKKEMLSDDKNCYFIENTGKNDKSISLYVISKSGIELMNFIDNRRTFNDNELAKIFEIDSNSKIYVHEKTGKNKYIVKPKKIISIN